MATNTFEERKAAIEQQRAKLMPPRTEGDAATKEENRKRDEKARSLILAAVLARATTNSAFYGVLLDVMDAEITTRTRKSSPRT